MIPIKDDNPSLTFPFVTISIICLNAAVFIYQLTLGFNGNEVFVYRTAAIPYEITHLVDIAPKNMVPLPLTLFTAMFIHGGFLHLAGNMLFLWIFGDNVEDTFGHAGFVLFYLATGLAASMCQVLVVRDSTMPMLGASGAVAGVLGAYFVLFPRAKVHTLVFLIFFITVVRIPAVFFLGVWFLFQVLGTGMGGGVAWYAHIGGFAAGALAVFVFRPRSSRIFS